MYVCMYCSTRLETMCIFAFCHDSRVIHDTTSSAYGVFVRRTTCTGLQDYSTDRQEVLHIQMYFRTEP